MDISKIQSQIVFLEGYISGLKWIIQEAQKEAEQKKDSDKKE